MEDLLPALIAGYEVGGVFESHYSSTTTAAGLRSSPLYGTLAAAAATAKLWGLTLQQTSAALANAASFSGGILQSFGDGTDEWRYQVGIAARNGLTAAALAAQGSVSAASAFEGKAGFVRAYVFQALGELPEPLRIKFRADLKPINSSGGYVVHLLVIVERDVEARERARLMKTWLFNAGRTSVYCRRAQAGTSGSESSRSQDSD